MPPSSSTERPTGSADQLRATWPAACAAWLCFADPPGLFGGCPSGEGGVATILMREKRGKLLSLNLLRLLCRVGRPRGDLIY